MAATVLGNISLGYQFLWSRLRQPVAVQLFVDTDSGVPVDARHLLAALAELWSAQAPILLLSVQSLPLLRDLLAHGGVNDPWVQVPQVCLADPVMRQRVLQANLRGLKMVWRGEPGQQPDADTAAPFHKRIVRPDANAVIASPVADQIVDAVTSRALAEHCLDRQSAWALSGWPVDDVLLGYQHKPIAPSQAAIKRLLKAIDDDVSLEIIEHLLSDEPVLAYRFLRHVNSPELGLRNEVESLWRGLMVLGYSALQAWLRQQLPQASSDLNLQPVRTTMVTRAHLMERLMDAGEEDELRREVYLCGLLSHIDRLLGEPLETALQRLPLSERVLEALLQQTGPYGPYLEIATALESPQARGTQELCEAHDINLEDVNRALLRTLASLSARSA
jgi:EAL and modified HD-GYP domain-containing signal transduction protein